jgi:hypothetical protein
LGAAIHVEQVFTDSFSLRDRLVRLGSGTKKTRTFYPHLGDRQENRLVNGTQQPVYVYACHDPAVAAELKGAIDEFFAHPNPAAALKKAGAFSKKAVVTA